MADTEEYFPRGGKKPTAPRFKQNNNFLGAPEVDQKKKKKPKKKTDEDDGYLSDDTAKGLRDSVKNCAYGISYKTIKAGTLILGRIRQITETKVNVMLPCRMMGSVMACHISEPYNRLLEAYVNDEVEKVRELSEIFRHGQYVALKVLEVMKDHLMLSMMPQHVNGGKMHADLHNGCLLQAAVSSVEDHGYVMDIGIPNTRAFLPKKHANPEIELDVGWITWCAVKSVATDTSVVTLTGQLSAIQAGVVRKKCNTPLLPATALDFTVDRPLDNGIEGHIFGDTTAYIQQQHTDSVKGKKPTLGQKVRARVLYVMPTRNTPFLTMKDIFKTTYPQLEEEQEFKEGDIIDDAQVIKITGRSIRLKMGRKSFGTMSLKRIQVDEDLNDEEVVAKSYPVGSTHKVRVLCYNLSDYNYNVTDQPSVVTEKYFSLEQLQVGEIVTGTVRTVTDTSVTVTVGRVTGYIPHAHLSDSGIFIDPKKATQSKLSKKKYKVGQEVKARVLSIDVGKQSLMLTLKPSLLLSDLEVLHSYGQACVGHAYTGVIKHIKDYLIVSFFNNVVAYVGPKFVSREPIDNLIDAFHVGQIVNCTIMKVDVENKKMLGSLITQPFTPSENKQKPEKRKQNSDIQMSPNKKRKQDNNIETTKSEKMQTDTDNSKKKKNKKLKLADEEMTEMETVELPESKKEKKSKVASESKTTEIEVGETRRSKKERTESESESMDDEQFDKKERKRKKKIVEDDDSKKLSEESDAIETDIHEEEVLTPQELGLIDLSDCQTAKQYKKRVVSLLKAVKCRTRRLDKVEKKILEIEDKGLNIKNKKFHTAMHVEKLGLQERIKKLMDVLTMAQEKLKEFGEDNNEYKSKKDKKTNSLKEENLSKSDSLKEKNVSKKDSQKKKKDIKVIDSLEPVLEVPSAKDFWSTGGDSLAQNNKEDESSSSEDEDKEQPKKNRKKLTVAEKLAKVRDEEQRVREMERRAIESEAQPRSSEQFERALLASPDCSQLWIAYMAFHLQATEIEKARAIGRKALNTISFREEQEKLNVWLAMLNCEHRFGTKATEIEKARAVGRKALNTISFREEQEKLNVWLALLNCEHRFGTKESQQKTLEEALQMNDPLTIHTKLLDILVETGKQQELASLVDLMLRKYKREPAMYIAAGGACYKLGLVDKARNVMQKAVALLEKKEHVSVLVQFALLERQYGAPERSEALFEQVLAVYPQRVDVCAVYVDMLVKSNDVDRVRQVMERMTSLQLPARKMKTIYKKWIEAEEKIGDEAHVESVQKRAIEYIDKAKF